MFTVTITTDNDAFERNHGAETVRILRDIADQIERRNPLSASHAVMDANGNHVGTWHYTHPGATK